MEIVRVLKMVQKITSIVERCTDFGFISQEAKALLAKLGVKDFGEYVEGEDVTL